MAESTTDEHPVVLAPDDVADVVYRQLFDAIDVGCCICEIVLDDAGRPVDYRILQTNPRYEEMTGLADAVGRTARELVPGLEEHWFETYGRVALGGEHVRFEQGSDAMGRWFDVYAMPVGDPGRFAVAFRDETGRHLAEQALAASDERARAIAERDRQNSLRLQHALLPAAVVEHPCVEIDACYHAVGDGLDVGGDWYDTFRWPTGEVGLMVGDVVGHNLDAAAAMGHLRAGTAALAAHIDPAPCDWIDALQECVDGPNGSDFVTACAVVLDTATGELSYCSAGHPPGLVVHPDGSVVWLDEHQSPPLGLIAVESRTPGTLQLLPGSVVVLYSDGLVERRDEAISAGLARLEDTARRLAADAGAGLCSTLTRELTHPSVPDDDVVTVTMRYLGPSV